jgi:hypothetical protein
LHRLSENTISSRRGVRELIGRLAILKEKQALLF